ncbi:MAG TPA: hypothetical protein VLE47_03810 [Candidatus Saccharimonadales bacterium]|nr:hypothetical protein [Candidatus Saccharimonadales bacterium]
MDAVIARIVERINSDPDEQRQLESDRLGSDYLGRYFDGPWHKWFLLLGSSLDAAVVYHVVVREDNSTLIATYDFHLDPSRWFQVSFEMEESGATSAMIYHGKGEHCWAGEIGELEECIVYAVLDPLTIKSSVA